jgi:cytochrome c biogenesis protein CcmG/thiol:disulfide interchange protein DsbE
MKENRFGLLRWSWISAALVACSFCLVAFPLLLQKKTAKPLAPDFTVKDSAGADFSLSSYKGKVVLLNFWATYCVPCRTEIPWFIEFDRTYRDKGFAVVGISMDEDWDAVRPYVAEKKINYRIGLGGEAMAKLYGGLEALPETFLLDREGRIAAHHVGLAPRAEVEKEIAQALAK